MHDQSVAQFDHMLGVLSGILRKAETHCETKKIDPAALLSFRLFPDMFPLATQKQLVTDSAQGAGAQVR